jgi:hypothetical protein
MLSIGCSDITENLGNGFFYRNEGGPIKDILCHKAQIGEIPATVVSFDYNSDFIIAKQKPKMPGDPLYDKEYQYKRGVDVYYYWLIIKKSNQIYGPLDLSEFIQLKFKYHIPEELQLNNNVYSR